MKVIDTKTFIQTLSLMGLISLGACAKQVDKVVETPIVGNSTPVVSQIAPARLCTDEITNTTPSLLAGFFGKVVRNIEGPPTFCLTLDTSGGASAAKGTLRMEYEDDFGIRYYSIKEQGTYFGTLEQTETSTSLEVVFIDAAGFIQVKAIDSGSGMMNGTIKYYNFPSYESSLTAAAEEAARKCRDGEMTVAQCLGYNFPSTFWWNQPVQVSPQQQMLDQAKAILADTTKTKTVGHIQFDLGLVLTQ